MFYLWGVLKQMVENDVNAIFGSWGIAGGGEVQHRRFQGQSVASSLVPRPEARNTVGLNPKP